ncbi:MAG TPA: heavy-metal-associated domain-containing protein [Anaerolineaceae bacterium]
MEKAVFQTPGLYADHHVSAARQRLLSVEGVQTVYASSTFFIVEVTFDETRVTQEFLKNQLAELGYLQEIPMLTESWGVAKRNTPGGTFRRTNTYAALKQTISFQQRVPVSRRALWNCPGIGVIQTVIVPAVGD